MGLKTKLFLSFSAFGLLAVGCTPATVENSSCKTSDNCGDGEICVEQTCYPRDQVPCSDDEICKTMAALCDDTGFCSTNVVNGDAGITVDSAVDDAASEPDVIETGDGIIAIIEELPIDFGDPIFNNSVERTFTIKNVGTSGLQIYAVTLASTTSQEFHLTPEGTDAGTILLPDATTEISISYILTDGEADIGEVEVYSDATDCQGFCANPAVMKVPLYSEFKGARNLAVTPTSHDFGFREQGQATLFAPFALTNDGTLTKVLTVSDVRLEGTDASHFELLFDPVPYYLMPAGEQVVRVKYVPTSVAFHSAEMVIEANSDDPSRQVARVALSGRSVPSASLSVPPSLDFGDVLIGEYAERTASAVNSGGMAATITAPARYETGGLGFTMVSPMLPVTVVPSGSETITLKFTPTAAGFTQETIYFDHDADGSPMSIVLTGRGVEPPQGYSSLRIEQRFSRAFVPAGLCSNSNMQNVDLEVVAGPYTCDKNAGGCTADVCQCNLGQYGSAVWSCGNCSGQTSTSENVSSFGSGSDGTFEIRAFYFDNCVLRYSDNVAAMQSLCNDTSWVAGCFPYSVFGHTDPYSPWHDANTMVAFATCANLMAYWSGKCGYTAATQVRTSIFLSGGTSADQTRHFCTDLTNPFERKSVANIERASGLFNLIGPLGTSQEIPASDPCGL